MKKRVDGSPPARILLIITDSGIGGTEKIVSLIARNLDQSRYSPVVCSVKPPGSMSHGLEKEGIPFFSLNFGAGTGIGGVLKSVCLVTTLRQELKRRNIDIVHSFLFLANMIGRTAARSLGLPNISSIRGEEWGKRYHHWCERMTSGMVSRYLFPSQTLADFASRRAGIPQGKAVVIPNAVEVPQPSRATLRQRLGLQKGDLLLGFVGRLHREKGADVLLEALTLLGPDDRFHLAIVGDGPDRLRLEEENETRGLGGRVHFTGWIPEASTVMGEFDALVLPSRSEGFPNVILEAMAARVPVLSANVGGVSELVIDGSTGFLFPPEDPEALAKLLIKIIRRSVDYERVVQQALSLVERAHQPADMVKKFQDLYDTILYGGSITT